MFSPHTRGCSWVYRTERGKKFVFPAYAGMFLPCAFHLLNQASFPRIRGDVPTQKGITIMQFEFSPHTRGCSLNPIPLPLGGGVFPAYAGMFRFLIEPIGTHQSFPRIRGDVDFAGNVGTWLSEFSPHTRGCSSGRPCHIAHNLVFPAYAGMFRLRRRKCLKGSCFPRIRGDVPPRLCCRLG